MLCSIGIKTSQLRSFFYYYYYY